MADRHGLVSDCLVCPPVTDHQDTLVSLSGKMISPAPALHAVATSCLLRCNPRLENRWMPPCRAAWASVWLTGRQVGAFLCQSKVAVSRRGADSSERRPAVDDGQPNRRRKAQCLEDSRVYLSASTAHPVAMRACEKLGAAGGTFVTGCIWRVGDDRGVQISMPSV